MMKVLVTGANGFIGKYVIEDLVSQGIDFATLGRSKPVGSYHHISSDILLNCHYSEIMSDIRPTHLIHLAWYAEHGRYWNSPANLSWITSTYNLLDAFYRSGGEHAVISGTCAEYDWSDQSPFKEGITKLKPSSIYGISKDVTDRLARIIAKKSQKSLTWARVFFPYGVGEHSNRLIPSLFKVFKNEKEPFGVNGNYRRDLMHASDLAKGLILCMNSQYDGDINLSSGEGVLIEEVVREIASICDANPECVLNLNSDRGGEPLSLVGCNKTLLKLGWQKKIELHDGLLSYAKEVKNGQI